MPYRHKETGEYYDVGYYSNTSGEIKRSFIPWNKNLDAFRISTDWVINIDDKSLFPPGTPMENRIEAMEINEKAFKEKVSEIFEFVELNPVVDVIDKPKYVKVIVEMNCPLCGSPLEHYDGTLLSSPLQYKHKCTNPDCNYHTTTRRFYSGQELWATSKEDAYRIISEGSEKEQEKLEKRKN